MSDAAPPAVPVALAARARDWIAHDPDPATRRELQALLEAGDVVELEDRFGGVLEFGTAGLRGVVGAGPNRMNRAVVIRTSRGLADHLLASVPGAAERGVVVGFDARRDSARFARDVVAVLSAAGLRVHRFTEPQPTPLVAYAQKVMDAAAAVVVTASHNPPEYNGYKVYGEGAAQIVPPTDARIAEAIERVVPAVRVPASVADERVAEVPDDLVERYLDDLGEARPAVDGPRLVVAYTPLHGVGGALASRAFDRVGAYELHVARSQAEPDARFPTVRFPNPEEPGAMDEVLAFAEQVDADLVLANDPDADRLAVAVPAPEGFRLLTGNQIGVLLADHLLAACAGERPVVVSSIVSTPMVHAVAADHGARSEVTLTGFKWIAAAARVLEHDDGRRFVYGFEEALGSTVGTVVHDKDGIGAAVAFAELARALAGEGLGVLDRWERLCRRHGLWVSHQHAVMSPGREGSERIASAVERVAASPPARLRSRAVREVVDYRRDPGTRPPWLSTADLVALELDDGRAMIRPSGTEPKCKIYVDLRAALGDADELDVRADELGAQARDIAMELAQTAGLG